MRKFVFHLAQQLHFMSYLNPHICIFSGIPIFSVQISNHDESPGLKATNLVVSNSIQDAWLPGCEILILSRTSLDKIFRRTMLHVEPYGDNGVLVSLDAPISPWPPNGSVMDLHNVDVILLSRNIVISQGSLTIYRTPTVAQVVNGVEFQKGNVLGSQELPYQTFLDFDRCNQNAASTLSNNIFRNGSKVILQEQTPTILPVSAPTLDLSTTSPSGNPSKFYNEVPSAHCQDDMSFKFKGKTKKGCRWVKRKKEKRCFGKIFEGKPLSEYCPKACGICRAIS